jgi:hypothetical protein
MKLVNIYKKDLLAHYVAGTPILTMVSILTSISEENAKKLYMLADTVYKTGLFSLSTFLRIDKRAKFISQGTFDECFYPSLTAGNYLLEVEKYLYDCIEMKKGMRKERSLIEPDCSDKYFMFQVFNFLNNTRETHYIE